MFEERLLIQVWNLKYIHQFFREKNGPVLSKMLPTCKLLIYELPYSFSQFLFDVRSSWSPLNRDAHLSGHSGYFSDRSHHKSALCYNLGIMWVGVPINLGKALRDIQPIKFKVMAAPWTIFCFSSIFLAFILDSLFSMFRS
ncbi:hypothetical protein MLD38_023468 [Melastoma candidum]|uniref:Uncharacterized protein n=1 Tax=Melastoma candidum TaxID=119954 RepID=A0ACB9NS69_9MYRT|nr:hypothetical protein MLD38_023468 [Melastoma candidum]